MALPNQSMFNGKRCPTLLKWHWSEHLPTTVVLFCCCPTGCQVVVSRLPVGHTHEDIDQKFSVISRVGNLSGPAAVALQSWSLAEASSFLPLQRLNDSGSDIITPFEFENVIRSAFNDIASESSTRVRIDFHSLAWPQAYILPSTMQVKCAFIDLWVAWDFSLWFQGHNKDAWPNELTDWTKRDLTVHSLRFTRATRAYGQDDERRRWVDTHP